MSNTATRVRFAPSPTGWLHVGGARTAYFNWLFARQRGGVFVIRIEDTDVERSSAESESGVLQDLAWLGLDWDEGPDRGGPHGPYRQSERLPLYRERAELLVSSGAAYPCFCTDPELEERRRAALEAGRPPQYDGRCRKLSAPERERFRAEGRPESIRFAVPERDWVLNDQIRGEVRFPAGMVGDFVILRSNGNPTYNFAATVDDAAMRISDVVRAEEHLANTPRQLMLYEALGEKPPGFAHVPLILNRDRTKMSKRSGEAAVAVADYRRMGYVSDALLSYLALLGFHTGDEREILSRADLLQAFTLERVGKSGAVFDPAKLRWVNAHYLHHATGRALRGWVGAARVEGESLPWISEFDTLTRDVRGEALEPVLELVKGNLTTLEDLPQELGYLLDRPRLEPDAAEALNAPRAREVCREAAQELDALAEWTADGIKSAIQRVGARLGVKGRDLFQPIRAALTGRTHGPELPALAGFLGKERAREYLKEAASSMTPGSPR